MDSKVSEGKLWTATRSNTALAQSGTSNVLLVVPAGNNPVLRVLMRCSARFTLELWEATDASNNGTALNVYNRRRSQAGSATVLAFHTPTVGDPGTLLYSTIVPPNVADETLDQWVLTPATSYLIRATNNLIGASTVDLNMVVNWYES
jgi:hypothetical protein